VADFWHNQIVFKANTPQIEVSIYMR